MGDAAVLPRPTGGASQVAETKKAKAGRQEHGYYAFGGRPVVLARTWLGAPFIFRAEGRCAGAFIRGAMCPACCILEIAQAGWCMVPPGSFSCPLNLPQFFLRPIEMIIIVLIIVIIVRFSWASERQECCLQDCYLIGGSQ